MGFPVTTNKIHLFFTEIGEIHKNILIQYNKSLTK